MVSAVKENPIVAQIDEIDKGYKKNGKTVKYEYDWGQQGTDSKPGQYIAGKNGDSDNIKGFDCSHYTKELLDRAGYKIPFFTTGAIYNGSANKYYNQVSANNVKPGDFAVTQGHIGVVTNVRKDKNGNVVGVDTNAARSTASGIGPQKYAIGEQGVRFFRADQKYNTNKPDKPDKPDKPNKPTEPPKTEEQKKAEEKAKEEAKAKAEEEKARAEEERAAQENAENPPPVEETEEPEQQYIFNGTAAGSPIGYYSRPMIAGMEVRGDGSHMRYNPALDQLKKIELLAA